MLRRLCFSTIAVLLLFSAAAWAQPPLPAFKVTGHVYLADGKTPAPRVTVTWRREGDASQKPLGGVPTTPDGSYTISKLNPGKYVLRCSLSGNRNPVEKTVTVADADLQVDFQLAGVYRVTGRLVDAIGRKLGNTRMLTLHVVRRATGRRSYYRRTINTDAAGRFSLIASTEGGGAFYVFVPGRGWWEKQRLDVDAKAGADLGEVKLRPGAILSGVVRNKETSEGIAGAQVRAYTSSSGAGRVTSGHSVASSEDGSYSIEGLPPGSYRVSASKQAFIGASQRVKLEEGLSSDEVVLELEPAFQIKGAVTAGQPAQPQAKVSVMMESGGRYRTDDNGAYTIQSARRGTHRLTAYVPGYAPVTRTVTVGPKTPAATVDFVVTDRGLPLSGVVLVDGKPAPAKTPVAAVEQAEYDRTFRYQVESQPFRGWDQYPWDYRPSAHTETDEKGRFTIQGLAAGVYVAVAFPADGPPAIERGITPRKGKPASVQLTAGWDSPRIFGGVIVDEKGEPLENSTYHLTLTWQSARSSRTTIHAGRTSASGVFWQRMPEDGPLSGEVKVLLVCEGRQPLRQTFKGVTPEKPLGRLTFRTKNSPWGPEDYGSIAGRVLMPDGKTPAVGVHVMPYSRELPWTTGLSSHSVGGQQWFLQTQDPAVTDDKGRFLIEGLPPGQYGVCASPLNLTDWPRDVLREELRGTVLATAEAPKLGRKQKLQGVEVRLGAGAALDVTVLDDENGKPLSDAYVNLSPRHEPTGAGNTLRDRLRSDTTDATGRLRLACVPFGTYMASASLQGYNGFLTTVEVKESSQSLEIRLKRLQTGTLVGRILTPDGKPLAGAKVRSWRGSNVNTDQDGRFVLKATPVGTQRLFVSHPDYAVHFTSELQLAENQSLTVPDIRMTAGGRITGKVVFEDAKPGPGESLLVSVTGGALAVMPYYPSMSAEVVVAPHAAVDADGTFTLEHVPAGEFTLSFWRGNRVVASKAGVNVQEGQTTTVQVPVVRAAGSISGRAVLADGKTPMVGVGVMAVKEGTQPNPMAANANAPDETGHFHIDHLAPGRYTIVVQGRSGGLVKHGVVVTNDKPVTGLELRQPEGVQLKGRVVDRKTKEAVTGIMVTNMTVKGMPPMPDFVALPEVPAFSPVDAEGRFEIALLPPGKHKLHVYRLDYRALQITPLASREVTVPEGAKEMAEIVIEVDAAAAPAKK